MSLSCSCGTFQTLYTVNHTCPVIQSFLSECPRLSLVLFASKVLFAISPMLTNTPPESFNFYAYHKSFTRRFTWAKSTFGLQTSSFITFHIPRNVNQNRREWNKVIKCRIMSGSCLYRFRWALYQTKPVLHVLYEVANWLYETFLHRRNPCEYHAMSIVYGPQTTFHSIPVWNEQCRAVYT